jgi:predicted RNA-binding Zn ribbon-like protein
VSQEAPGKLEAVRLFVNSVDFEEDAEELSSPSALATWLEAHELGPVGRASSADVARAIELREALRELLLGQHGDYTPDPSAARVVEETARRARLEVRFGDDGVAGVGPGASGVDAALGRLLAIVADAQADGTWSRMKACPWETCRWAFYDRSKNRSGVWCNMAVCGNRAKARAYRERQAQSRPRARRPS